MAVVHRYFRTRKKFPHVWCAGCGHGIITASIIRAIDKIGIDRNKVVLVSGIGCSSRAPVYFDFNTLHTTHGRAIPFATGVKLANPELTVIVITGDGDATAIGGNHFIHACRRNIDLNLIVYNNNIYGMTGGQCSPTTPSEKKSSTTPYGNMDNPFDICSLAAGAGASFVARVTAHGIMKTDKTIEKAIKHKGLCVIDAISQCETYFGRPNKLGTNVDMMKFQKENSITIEKAEKLSPEEKAGKIITGIFVEKDIPEYSANYRQALQNII